MERESISVLADELQLPEPTKLVALPSPFSFDKLPLNLPSYKGSAELLLWLLRRQFVEIEDVPVREIAHQAQTCHQNPIQKADALALTAELILLKSALLLPQPEPEVFDFEENELQEGEQLKRKLLRNAAYGLAANFLSERSKVWSQMFSRPANEDPPLTFKHLLLSDEPIALLTEALRRVLVRMAGIKVRIPRRRLTVPQRIRMLLQILKSMPNRMATFEELCSDCESLLEVIITFLAVLELIRRNWAGARQDEPFGSIIVFLKGT